MQSYKIFFFPRKKILRGTECGLSWPEGESGGEFAADGAAEVVGDFGGGEAEAEEIHELGDGGFGGDVVAGYGSGGNEGVAGGVAATASRTASANHGAVGALPAPNVFSTTPRMPGVES